MELTHKFTVPASVEDTWAAFNDIESVAGCFPGATVSSVEGDHFKGSCKVKLGPISLVYSGSGYFVERDESAHRFVIDAKGKDNRGNGTAGAKVTATLTSDTPGTTHVEVNTDLAITGKPAQFGRGIMQDVSDKLLQQFADCLEAKVGGPAAGKHLAESPAESPAGGQGDDVGPAAGAAATSSPGAAGQGHEAAAPTQERDDALDLGATLLPILLKSYWKPIVGGLVALWVLRKLLGGRRS